MYKTKDFGEPPPGYVPGIGRGAIGFTTRSDIGPAKNDYGSAPVAQKELVSYDDSQFDKFSGYRQSLFSGVADNDDLSAERVYAAIDRHLDSRRKVRREKLENKLKNITLDVYEQFQQHKKELAQLSEDDWNSIPEAGRMTKKPKTNKRAEKITPVPDLIIHSAHETSVQNIDSGGTITPLAPTPATPVDGSATPVNLTQLGHARERVLDMALGKLSDSVDGQTVVDPKGYLTDLRSRAFAEEGDVSDVEKARVLFRSITTTNPSSAFGWIGAARLEEHVGKISKGRKIIMEGSKACPASEDLWLEAIRLHDSKPARAVAAQGLSFIPKSEKLWLKATQLEETREAKRGVLRRALQILPGSVSIWKAAIDLENEKDARALLAKAVRCVPGHLEFWLALARLESHAEARKVLNEARHTLPTEPRIWIAAARLEEANGFSKSASKLISKAFRSLQSHGVMIDRNYWIAAAYECEETKSPSVCEAIVHTVLGEGVEKTNREATWKKDAENATALGKALTARYIYSVILERIEAKSSLWIKAANAEKNNGLKDIEALVALLRKAVVKFPKSDSLWLMLAKEKEIGGKYEEARQILAEAIDKNPQNEAVYIEAARLEFENGSEGKARELYAEARSKINSPEIWEKSALLEREMGKEEKENELLKAAIAKFKKSPKLWAHLGKSYEKMQKFELAKKAYKNGTKNCPKSVSLWILRSELEAKTAPSVARSLLENARLLVPKSAPLWLASVRLEAKFDRKVALLMLSRALSECPNSGEIWAFAVDFEEPSKRKTRCHDALKALADDPFVFLSAAKLFWNERKTAKARNWFERSLVNGPEIGDTWAFYYAFLERHGTKEEQTALLKRCEEANPSKGELWQKEKEKPGSLRKKDSDVLKDISSTIKM